MKDKAWNLAARWLVVLLTSLMLLDSAAGTPSARARKPACTACVRCQCCLKEAPTNAPAPLAPTSSQRVSVEKDFQWLLTASTFLVVPEAVAAGHSSCHPALAPRAAAPLYARHCTYLI